MRDILLGRVRKVVTSPTAGEGAEAFQAETFSLDFFLNLVTQGQPIAVELLFALRSAHIVKPDPLWLELIKNRDRLLTCKTVNFADYCKPQATVYSRPASGS